MAVSGNITIRCKYDSVTVAGTAGSSTDHFDDTFDPGWQTGTVAGQFNLAASLKGTLSASTNNHTLSAFPGPNSSTIAFAVIREFYLRNTGATALTVAPGGTHPWAVAFSASIDVPPGGMMLLVAPDLTAYPVVASTTDQFSVTSAGVGSYTVELKGA